GRGSARRLCARPFAGASSRRRFRTDRWRGSPSRSSSFFPVAFGVDVSLYSLERDQLGARRRGCLPGALSVIPFEESGKIKARRGFRPGPLRPGERKWAGAGAASLLKRPFPFAGRKGGHKGRARQYTSPEEIDAQLQAEKQKAREEEEQGEDGDGATGDPKKEKKSLDSDDSDEEDEDYQQKRKGVEGLIDIENPNRIGQTTKKVTQLDLDGPKELSRREREEIEKQKAKERYMKMHLAGKTEQAKADLARLAIIRKQREEAAKKKEEERKAKDDATVSGKRLQSLSLNK
uniref:PDGFA associated protein 1 n=2 Tax=Ornithorhynchus anatinus TaxID=9258 RepID=A0A6I8PE84_ORNAN